MKGAYSEEYVITRLKQICDLDRQEKYDHQYKLDFIITKFHGIDKLFPLGVQITTNSDDMAKQQRFLMERRKRTLVDRSLYVQINPKVDLETFGVSLIYHAMIAFAFEKTHQDKFILGVKINPDVTFEFFELGTGESGARPRGPISDEVLEGRIVKYYPKNGYGFISTEDRGDFFFHISDVLDRDLRETFLPNVEIEYEANQIKTPVAVTFNDGGLTRADATSPTARNIRRQIREGNEL
jgi:cold shock CspA family protein